MGSVPIIGLKVDASWSEDRVELVVAGELDVASSPSLQRHVDEIVSKRTLVVDLSAVTFMDSTGLRCLWSAREHMRASGGTMMLRSPSPAVVRVLRATKLDEQFSVEGL